jgi:predicted GNAT family N-acyltransferase
VAAADLDAWRAALALRYAVFVVEQHVPAGEEVDRHDVHDWSCLHVLADVAGRPIGTGRIYESAQGEGKIGRIAVDASYRGLGAGTAILQALIKEGRHRGLRSLILDAQTQAVRFYERHGFAPEGEVFVDCGIPHRQMRLALM